MSDRTNRLKELLTLLASLQSRRQSGGGSFDESRWAAIRINNEFGEDAIIPLAGTLSFWELLDPNNHLMIRQFGLRDSEIAKRCKSRAIAEATWCLEQISGSIPVLIGLLGNENAMLRANAARALGYLRTTDAVELLIESLADSDKGVIAAASSALKRMTGKSFFFGGSDPRKWRQWWNKRKDSFPK